MILRVPSVLRQHLVLVRMQCAFVYDSFRALEGTLSVYKVTFF